jgi:hypothetical protein
MHFAGANTPEKTVVLGAICEIDGNIVCLF